MLGRCAVLYFHLRTSMHTGAINAILLARLGMSIIPQASLGKSTVWKLLGMSIYPVATQSLVRTEHFLLPNMVLFRPSPSAT